MIPLSPKLKSGLQIFLGLCIVLALLDFSGLRHEENSVDGFPFFYSIYGFVGCVILVLVAKEMRKLVMRSEDYYKEVNSDNSRKNKDKGEH